MKKKHKNRWCDLKSEKSISFLLIITLVLFIQNNTLAINRWSAIQLVPDADLIEAGNFISNINTYFFDDIYEGKRFRPSIFFNAGIKDWVNIEVGFAGSFTCGVKAKILDESAPYLPSFVIGVRNIFYHRECWFFARNSDSLGSEVYFSLGKSIEPIHLRLHAGLQSIPYSENELINPFIAMEKYLGAGFYITTEIYRREKKPNASLFIVSKLLKNQLEISTGLIDLYGMFVEREGLENASFYNSNSRRFIRPGIWMSIRLNTPVKALKSIDGKESFDNKVTVHEIEYLKLKIDSLQRLINSLKTGLNNQSHSELDIKEHLKVFVKKKLEHINILYNTEPFDPESVKIEFAELEAKGEKILPFLYEIALDTTKDNKIGVFAITTMGRIKSESAEELILKILKEDYNTELTIECLIALGKRGTPKNIPIIRKFTTHSNSDIAFTASEILEKIEKESSLEPNLEKEKKIKDISDLSEK